MDDWHENFFLLAGTKAFKRWEIFSEEYIDGFAKYLGEEIEKMHGKIPGGRPVGILEIGAGFGVFATLVNSALKKYVSGEKYTYTAIDNGSQTTNIGNNISDDRKREETLRKIEEYKKRTAENMKNKYPKSVVEVQDCDAKDAASKYDHDIVICSWPSGESDIAAPLRKSSSLQQLIIIGIPEMIGSIEDTMKDKKFSHNNLEQLEQYQKLSFLRPLNRPGKSFNSSTKVFLRKSNK